MKYENIKEAIFISRPNRFVAEVDIEGEIKTVHVKNTGRCRELLVHGAKVYLYRSDSPLRKTEYDLVAVQKKREDGSSIIINIDSQIPNAVALEWFFSGNSPFSKDSLIKREVGYGNSRFDFYIESEGEKIFLEVKGVTLENNGVAMFPDAPTERGVKHLRELITAKRSGYEAYVLFIIQMKGIRYFTPNTETHAEFAELLKKANTQGVHILAVDCKVEKDSITADKYVKTVLVHDEKKAKN
ncbi:MAG: DNA/RNA nuclease SfsA [Ruminococcaceae bacterium]|nr:DNA/RNA nuclease SfsA [Oscillospiraceae bacterium]